MITPLKVLKQAAQILEQLDCRYCLIGGHAASLYRTQERLTRDVDFAVVGSKAKTSRIIAERCIEMLGFEPALGWIPQGVGELERKSICMITSKPAPDHLKGFIDILLPELPWVEIAVKRAQDNKLDLGFSVVPVITPEDLIIAKCYALRNTPDRFQDLDDLKEIFQLSNMLDIDYLRSQLQKQSLEIPEPVREYSPIA